MKRIVSKSLIVLLLVASTIFITIPKAKSAGISVYKEGHKYVKLGGRIQMQYHLEDPADSDSTDELYFRRFRLYIEGSIHKDWKGKFQWDMGEAKLQLKDAYMQYRGIEQIAVTIGNAYFPFSREVLTSSKYQQLVERTFVGDHNYGTPDRVLGIHITGHNNDKSLTYGFSMAEADIDPDEAKLDFDSPVNKLFKSSKFDAKEVDFNQGWMYGGRVDYHSFGYLKFSQGDFDRETKATIGVAVFQWSNDNDNNDNTVGGADEDAGTPDVDSVTGFEVSGAFRFSGFSVDAEYNSFKAETVDSAVTGGIFENGETTLVNYAIEGGYMIVPSRLEIVAGYQSQNANGYEKKWTRTSAGVNYFFAKHDIKTQLTYRMGENIDGVDGGDKDEIFVQMQYVF